MKEKVRYSLADNYLYIYKNIWNQDKKIIFCDSMEILFSVLQPLSAAALPAMILDFLQKGLNPQALLINISGCFAVYGFISTMSAYFKNRNRNQYIKNRQICYWKKIFLKCITLDLDLYEREENQIRLSAAFGSIDHNTDGVEGMMHTSVSLWTNIFGLICYSLILSRADPIIIGLLLVLALIQMGAYSVAKNVERSHAEQKWKNYISQRYLFEQAYDVNAGKDIRLYQLQKWLENHYHAINERIQKLQGKENRAYYLYDCLCLFLAFFKDALCYGILLLRLADGLALSEFVLYLGIVSGFSAWFTTLAEDIAKMAKHSLKVSDFREYIGIMNHSSNEGGVLLDTANELNIVFDHVSFSYPQSDKKVLDDVSFSLCSDKKVALVGVNGAGKTTIVKLLCGFYEPTCGRILVNGTDLKECNLSSYFRKIAAVFQDNVIFSYTLGENVSCCTKEKTDRARLEKACRRAGLWEKIEALPKGLDTYLNKDIDPNGILLSGGELQKLMLARALYKQGKMLILDEPTAALDALAESEMYEKYGDLTQGSASLFISHRLSSTKFCDEILFLQDGKIKERGTHDELMRLQGKYTEMFNVQSQYYQREGEKYE